MHRHRSYKFIQKSRQMLLTQCTLHSSADKRPDTHLVIVHTSNVGCKDVNCPSVCQFPQTPCAQIFEVEVVVLSLLVKMPSCLVLGEFQQSSHSPMRPRKRKGGKLGRISLKLSWCCFARSKTVMAAHLQPLAVALQTFIALRRWY